MEIHQDLQNAIKKNELIIFVGAGYSSSNPLNIPTWRKLIKCFITDIKDIYPETKYLDVLVSKFDDYQLDEIQTLHELKKNGFENDCLNILKKEIDIDLASKNLSKFTNLWRVTDRIVTTNYDKAIESSVKNVKTFTHTDKKDVANLEKKQKYLWKLHGCIDKPKDCILFEDNYENLYNNNRLVTFELRNLFAHKTILFLGFSLSDPYINYILKDLKEIYEGYKGKNLLLTTKNEDFSIYDIETIKLNNWEELDNYIEELVSFKNTINFCVEQAYNLKIKELDEKGVRYDSKNIKDEIELVLKGIGENDAKIDEYLENGDFEAADNKLKNDLNEILLKSQYHNRKAAQISFNRAKLKRLELKYEEAYLLYKQTTELFPENPFFLTELGSILHDLKRFDTAIATYKQAIELETKGFGDNSLLAGDIYSNIGEAYYDIKNYKQSLYYYEKAINFEKNILGENNLKIGKYYIGIGNVYRELNDTSNAFNFYQKTIALELSNNVISGDVFHNLGVLLMKTGEFREAIDNFGESLKFDIKIYEKSHKNILLNSQLIGESLEKVSDVREIINYYHQMLNFYTKNFQNDTEGLAYAYNKLGIYYKSIFDYTESYKYYTLAISAYISLFGLDHYFVADAHNNMGLLLYELKNYTEAESYFKLALMVDAKFFGEEHHTTATDYNNLGLISEALNQKDEANQLYKKAFKILTNTLGSNHPSTKAAKQNIDNLSRKLAWWKRF